MNYEVEDVIADIKSLSIQYMNDLKYPPKDDSIDRRVQWINSILAKVEHPVMTQAVEQITEKDDLGCEYCRMGYGPLNDNDCCPKCDAQFDPEED